jgi:hypothetical protein
MVYYAHDGGMDKYKFIQLCACFVAAIGLLVMACWVSNIICDYRDRFYAFRKRLTP